MFFEGSEKKVEIVIQSGGSSLRPNKTFWHQVVARANATVLSTLSGSTFDAYLLSESSLFVYDDKVIMITCGTTSLADAIEDIIDFVGVGNIRLLMYERKNEHNPEAQPTSFEDDVAMLRRFVPGEVIRFGETDGTRVFLFHYGHSDFKPPENDTTLEILMHGLSDSVRENFSAQNTREQLYEQTGINKVFKGAMVDDYLFEPMGYSVNAAMDQAYYTFHVTPEKACSYASFETNRLWRQDLNSTIQLVLGIFNPEKFALIFFDKHGRDLPQPEGYRPVAETDVTSCGYRVQFRDFHRLRTPITSKKGG